MRNIAWLLLAVILAVPGWADQAGNTASPAKKITVPSGVMAGQKIAGENPVYPPTARMARVQGTVVLHATIAKDGAVKDVQVISGLPMLQGAAVDAIRTWRYRPYLLNGQPVEVETDINVTFVLPPPQPLIAEKGSGPVTESPTADSAAAAVPSPGDPVTADQVEQLMTLTGTAALQKQMMHNMMPALQKAMPPYMPQDVLDDFERSVLGKDMQDAIVRVYQQHLSSEDAAAAIAFYKTPAGQRMLAATPVIMQELQSAGAQIGMKVMQEVVVRHKMEIQAAKDKYDQEHPWSVPKN